MHDFSKLTISYSLFGSQKKYIDGLHSNLAAISNVYPQADVVVYTDKPYVFETAHNKVLGISKGLQGAFWRYYEYKHEGDGHVIFRDADSIVTDREAAMVHDWMDSNAIIHTIHDSAGQTQCHGRPMMAGMTGIKNGSLPYDFAHLVRWWCENKNVTQYRDDEHFLNKFLWPYCRREGLLHSSVVGSKYGGTMVDPPAEPTNFIGARAYT